MAVLDTTAGNLVIKDIPHAIIKDPRTLFSTKQTQDDTKADVPELHVLCYYGDIVGPTELNLRNKCVPMLQSDLKNWKNNVLYADDQSVLLCEQMFEQSIIEITHISHYSIEFVLNISNTAFLDEMEHKTDVSAQNYYFVATYQQSEFQKHMDEFITIGITSSISYTQHTVLYNFYVDDFVHDLFKILSNTAWYDNTCKLSDKLFYEIAQYATDCIRPIPYIYSTNDEILLNDGQLHVFLTGNLKPENDLYAAAQPDLAIDDKLEIIAQTMTDLGRQIYNEYKSNKNAQKIKSEYDKWKKVFRKREDMSPGDMFELEEKLEAHQRERYEARDSIHDINQLKHLYFMDHNFKLKFGAKKKKKKSKTMHLSSPRTMNLPSLKTLFSFGSSLKKKSKKHKAAMSYNPALDFLKDSDHPSFHNYKPKHRISKSLNMKVKKRYRKSGILNTNDITTQLFESDTLKLSDSKSKSYGDAHKYEKENKKSPETKSIFNDDLKMDNAELMFSNSSPLQSGSGRAGKGHHRSVSMTVLKAQNEIKSAYKEYERDKGYSARDVQSFVTYCKKRKNIKKANWSLCKAVMEQMK